jgi:putative membrane protein
MRKFLPVAALAALAAGCASHNIGAPGTSLHSADAAGGAAAAMDMSDMTPEAAMPYVMMAGASDLFEIQSSQMAVQRATRPEVRQYAQMLIQHHQMTTQQVMAAARAAGLNPRPPMLLPMQRQMLAQLRGASGGNFDRVYITQQVPAHEMALALHSNYASRGDRPQLRAVAGQAVPIVTQHLQQAQQMMGMMQ